MSDLSELYQQLIVDHYKSPRNHHALAHANHSAEGFNPLCGDHVRVFLEMDGDTITDIGFTGYGCAISTAAASTMTVALKGKSRADADRLFDEFRAMLQSNPDAPADVDLDTLGSLAAFSGVCQFPTRIKCASLPWHALHAALHDTAAEVMTE